MKQQSVVRHIIRSEAKSDITPLIISLVLCLSKRAIFVDLENGVFTIKQKNPEYFGPEVRGKIIFQKFQSKTEDYVLRYSFSHWGWKKTNGIALTICLFLGSGLAVYIFAPFIDKQCQRLILGGGVAGHTFRFLSSNIHPTPCDVTLS